MVGPRVFTWLNIVLTLIFIIFTATEAAKLRAFTNPLNNKVVDLFIAVDESNIHMNSMQLGLMKTALSNIVTDLNPPSSNPYFGLYFYGATSSIQNVVPFTTNSAAAFKSFLDKKQYSTTQASASNLNEALDAIEQNCTTTCRLNAPRVTLVISSVLDSSAKTKIREMEKNLGMTVMIAIIGQGTSPVTLKELVSHPVEFYGISIFDYFQLILISTHISATISDVPRLLSTSSALHIPTATNEAYHTVLVNTLPYSADNDIIILFASNCPSCAVYGSLSQPIPIADNTLRNTDRHNFYAYSGYPNSLYYFRVPKNTGRFFISFLGNGATNVYVWVDAFPVPNLLSN